jgi:hypothetical protein
MTQQIQLKKEKGKEKGNISLHMWILETQF